MDILQRLKAKSRATIQNLRPTDYQDAAVVQAETNAFGTILGQIDKSGKYPIVFRMDGRNRPDCGMDHRRELIRQLD